MIDNFYLKLKVKDKIYFIYLRYSNKNIKKIIKNRVLSY